MKKNMLNNIKILALTIILIILTRLMGILPWWSFIIPVVALGIVMTIKKWSRAGFGLGFLAGFLTWAGANLYFDAALQGAVLDKLGLLLSVPAIVIVLLSGIIGGLLTGLALYTGKALVAERSIGI